MAHLPLIVLVGPTGVGKTALAITIARSLAEQRNLLCEVISADSRQIYQGLDIGAAKPTPAECALLPHRLVDLVPPAYTLTLAEFQERAYRAINEVQARGNLPWLVGGTGQWVQAVVEGWGIPRVPPDPVLRAELAAEAQALGQEKFHARLAAIDPQAAAKIDPRNTRRVIRALEVYAKTGRPISQHQQKKPPPYRLLQLGLTMPRQELYLRIDKRIDRMLAQGLLVEVAALVAQGYGWQLPAMSGLGYKQFAPYFEGKVTLAEVVANIKKDTRRFIRQQYNWFRLEDEAMTWVDVSQAGFEAQVMEAIRVFLTATK